MGSWPESLVVEFAERRAALFLGAGVSRAASSEFGKTVKGWSELLKSMAASMPGSNSEKDLVKKLINRGTLLDAAQVIRDKLTAGDFATQIRNNFRISLDHDASIYKSIVKIDPLIVFTTNYDQLLETSLNRLNSDAGAFNVCLYNQGYLLDDIRSPTRSVIKVHGSVTDPGNVILSRGGYYAARRDNASFFRVCEAAMMLNTILFVGYSFSDPDIQLILENNSISSPTRHTHFALVERLPHASIKKCAHKRIQYQLYRA